MESSTHTLNYTEHRYGLLYDSVLTNWFGLGDRVSVIDNEGKAYSLRIHSMRPRIDGLTDWHRRNATEIGDTVRIERTGANEIRIAVVERAGAFRVTSSVIANPTPANAHLIEDYVTGRLDRENLVRAIELINQAMGRLSPKKVDRTVRQSIRSDSQIVQLLKQLHENKCQFPDCRSSVIKRDGSNYVEVAHVKPVHFGGQSILGNLLVLCPNHHKEFDLGDLVIDQQEYDFVSGRLNGKVFRIDMTF